MTRTVDLVHRADLLDRITEYIVANGVANLSLRPLANAVGVSPRTLLYHFGSKDEIVSAAFRHTRRAQIAVIEDLKRTNFDTPGAICKAAWSYMTSRDIAPKVVLFFETYAIALRDPERFAGFLEGAIQDWLTFLSSPLCARGVDPVRARTIATVVLAGYRGFMLDYAATRDERRIGNALDAWLDSLKALYPHGERHAQQA